MNNIRTKEEIVQYMIKYTEKFRMNADLDAFTTHAAADEIKISRNLASSYLGTVMKLILILKAFDSVIPSFIRAMKFDIN